MKPMKPSRQLVESKFQWSRGPNLNWVCQIENCSRSFCRKCHLVAHRDKIHNLSTDERKIPDQRSNKKKGVVKGFYCATGQSVHPYKSTNTINEADKVRSLIANGRQFIRNSSAFDELSFDEIVYTFHYGIESRFSDRSSSTGFELVAQLLDRLRDNRRFNERLRLARERLNQRTDAARHFKCGARFLKSSIQKKRSEQKGTKGSSSRCWTHFKF